MKKILLILTLVLSVLTFFQVTSVASTAKLNHKDKEVFKIMRDELNRSMKELKKKGSIAPYFISYTLKENDVTSITASYGAIYGNTSYNLKKIAVDVRVGSYKNDNTDLNNAMGRRISAFVAIDGDPDSLKRDIWFQTNAAYEYAVKMHYFKKQQQADQFKKKVKVASYAKEKPHRYYEQSVQYDFDKKKIEDFLKKATKLYREYPEIQFDISRFNFGSEKIYYLNSEGTEILTNANLMNISIDASTQANDGVNLQSTGAAFFNMKFEKPNFEKIKKEIDRVAKELIRLKSAPTVSPETGPAILSAQATGVLFHEAVGHRLEGERQDREEEGRTFKDSLGKKVIPKFLTVYDDPTAADFKGIYLNGYYKFDDEGVPGQKVVLIKNGILKNFLMSRTPIENFSKSNGHGRSYDDFVPMARMSNFFVKSTNMVSSEKLKKMLVDECKKQNKKYGFIIESMLGGETETAIAKFQVFKSVPQIVYRIDSETGKEELVRGVEIVGTPLSSINKIIVTGDDYEAKNGYCGAESGWIKVSTVAPSTLVSEIELQNRKVTKKQLPIIKRPD